MSFGRIVAVVAVALAITSCTLTRPRVDRCTDNAGCRQAFGFGYTCGQGGYCIRAARSQRCRPEPGDLFDRPHDYKDSIVFGSILNSSQITDQVSEHVFRLALRQVNELGGFPGVPPPVGMVFCDVVPNRAIDSHDEIAATSAVARYLARDLGVPAILGPATSRQVAAAYPESSAAGALMMSHSATSPSITMLDAPSVGLLWRTAMPDSVQGAVIASDLASRGVTRVVVIHESGPYGEGLAAAFQAQYVGQPIVHMFVAGNRTDRDRVIALAGADPATEVLFVSSDVSDAPALLNAAAGSATLSAKRFFLTDGAANDALLTQGAGAVSIFGRVRGTRPSTPRSALYDAFLPAYAAYRASIPSAPPAMSSAYAAHAYDAAWLTFTATAWSIARRSTVTGANLRDALRHLSNGNDADLGPERWISLSDSFFDVDNVDIRGASGELDYDADDETRGAVDIWGIDTSGTPVIYTIERVER